MSLDIFLILKFSMVTIFCSFSTQLSAQAKMGMQGKYVRVEIVLCRRDLLALLQGWMDSVSAKAAAVAHSEFSAMYSAILPFKIQIFSMNVCC